MFLNKINNIFLCLSVIFISFTHSQVSVDFGSVDLDAGTMEITMDTSVDVGGFQFDVTGLTIESTSGGDLSDAAGFTVSAGTNTVLGFSFSGGTIPAGSSGSLASLTFTATGDNACLETVTVSDPAGIAIEVSVGECVLLSEPVLGCTDVTACNYDADANEDDGSCTYAEENFDCDGNCLVDVDCEGVCGGMAMEDCEGTCNGTAVEDDCGVCGGSNSTGCVASISLGSFDESLNSMDVLVQVGPDDLSGFQFTLSGLESISAFGGLAGDAGFQVSAGDSGVVIGFSLTGAFIPAGSSGVLTSIIATPADGAAESCMFDVTMSDPEGNAVGYEVGGCVALCTDVDMDGICDDVDDCVGEFDDCGECNGDGTSCLNVIYFGAISETDDGNSAEVWISTVDDVAGIQFDVTGMNITGTSGGLEDEGWNVSANASTVLVFSLTGQTVAAGSMALLTNLTFDVLDFEGCLDFGQGAISDTSGNSLPAATGACVMFDSAMGGCTDDTACNFDDAANVDDGSCEYPEENFDCNGDCIVDIDECGVCGGTGPEDNFDCEGNFIATKVQVIHNSADPTVDVYVDGALAVDGFEYRTATPVLILPTSFTVGIAPAGGDVIAEFPFELVEGGEYVVVATGILGDETTPFDLAAAGTSYETSSDDVVGLKIYHGSTDAPSVDILADANDGSILVSDLAYSEFTDNLEVPAADYNLGVAPTGADAIAAFLAPLSGLGGGTAVAFASGFLAPAEDQPAFGLFAALVDGTVLELPALEQDCAGVWDGDSELDDCGVCNGGNADQDECGVCFGDGPSFECTDGTIVCGISECDTNISISFGTLTAAGDATGDGDWTYALEVLYSSTEPIAGFQFTMTGPELVGIEGGAASDVFGEQVQWSDLGIVIGFSLTGDSIPAGEGLLTNLWIQGSAGQTEACLTDVVISDSAGGAFDEVTVGGCVNVEDTLSNIEIPNEVSLSQNYPNPFNPVTNIDFSVDVSGMVSLKVYDISGKEVSNLVNDYLTPGNYSIKWNATDNYGNELSSGMYIYQLNTNNGILTNSMILMR